MYQASQYDSLQSLKNGLVMHFNTQMIFEAVQAGKNKHGVVAHIIGILSVLIA